MLNSFLCREFLFLQFLLGYLFLLCNLLFWLWNDLFLLSEDHLSVAGGAHVWVNPAMSSVGL
ncbi:mCG1041280 [Mus musculus]|nr:mCG1041280 [Mus musculus]